VNTTALGPGKFCETPNPPMPELRETKQGSKSNPQLKTDVGPSSGDTVYNEESEIVTALLETFN